MKKIAAFIWEHFLKPFLEVMAGSFALIGAVMFVMGPLFGFAWMSDEIHGAWAFGTIFWMIILCGITKWLEENWHEISWKNKKG